MTITIGNPNLPGVYATQESGSAVRPSTPSPADVGIVGEADLVNGAAVANTVYTVTTASQASRLFGSSPLGRNVADAIQNGSMPVYAVAASSVSVTDEDVSGFTTSGTLANAPVSEDPSNVSISIDSTSKSVSRTFMDPQSVTVGADEAVYNPTTGEVELDIAPSTTGLVSYDYLDYNAAIDALANDMGTVVDFYGVLTENAAVLSHLESTINALVTERNFAMGVIGAASYITDTSAYSLPVDNQRMQLAFGSRDADGESLIGAWVGRRGAIGIQRSGMRVRLSGKTAVYHSLSDQQKEELHAQNVLVFETDRGSVRSMNDPTAVDPTSSAAEAYNNGLAAVVADYISEVVINASESFISRLNTESALRNLEDIIRSGIDALVDADVLVSYSVFAESIDARNVRVEIGLEFAEPIETINVVLVGGEIQ
jgi:hypothetical protein